MTDGEGMPTERQWLEGDHRDADESNQVVRDEDVEPPRQRHIEVRLKIGADDAESLSVALRNLANDVLIDGTLTRPGNGASGGWDAGFNYAVTVDESMTGDRYREELERWRQARVRLAEGGSDY